MTDPLHDLTAATLERVEQPAPEFADRLRRRIEAIEARAVRPRYHLAELNLGRFRAPLDSPEMVEFANALDRINALADEAPGFVWRLTDDDGGPSSNVPVPGVDDPLIASNLSVWTDLESLRDYMYRSDHVGYLRRRSDWFVHTEEAMVVAWWIPAGTLPTLAEAIERLEHLRRHGPSDEGWPLTQPRPAPDPDDPDANQGATMTAEEGTTTSVLIPYLSVGDARRAIEFYAEVFGAEQQGEAFEMDDGRIGHAELSIRGHALFLADDFPEINLVHPAGRGGPHSVGIVIAVDDCDAVFAHAIDAGATADREPVNQHGHRGAWIFDPWGHRWHITGPETV